MPHENSFFERTSGFDLREDGERSFVSAPESFLKSTAPAVLQALRVQRIVSPKPLAFPQLRLDALAKSGSHKDFIKHS
jgi:hypothetical protein